MLGAAFEAGLPRRFSLLAGASEGLAAGSGAAAPSLRAAGAPRGGACEAEALDLLDRKLPLCGDGRAAGSCCALLSGALACAALGASATWQCTTKPMKCLDAAVLGRCREQVHSTSTASNACTLTAKSEGSCCRMLENYHGPLDRRLDSWLDSGQQGTCST